MDKTRVITDESQIPNGFVPLAKWAANKTIHRRLSDAHASGTIEAVKLMRTPSAYRTGPVWVDEQQAVQFLASLELSSKPRDELQPVEQCSAVRPAGPNDWLVEQAADMRISLSRCVAHLGDIYDAIEVIARQTAATAKACEEIATRPLGKQ